MPENARHKALTLFQVGVAAADPARAVHRSLNKSPLEKWGGRLFVVAVGKAARGMAQAAQDRLHPAETLVVTTRQNATPLAGATVLSASHPVPDETSLAAGRAVRAFLAQAGGDDHVLALISGGGSALMVAPVAGLSLGDKAQVNRLLLTCGMDITAMNMVRQTLSRLKGGGLARAAAPARLSALILSDVVGDDLRVVASGPTTAPIGTPPQARAALKAAGIWQDLPQAVQAALSAPVPEPESANLPLLCNRLIGSNAHSVAAMAAADPGGHIFPRPLVGDVADAARLISAIEKQPLTLFGGEVTVRLKGTGLGGRNQELALRVALEAQRVGWPDGWVFLSGGTDGQDGPTDAAGGLVDSTTLARIRAAGIDPVQALKNNDSYPALAAAGDLLITGPTATNVADLQVLIRP